jgi:predicted dehydrogenase
MHKVRIAIVGVGMHFQETYTTALKRKDIRDIVEVSWVADLSEKKDIVTARLKAVNQKSAFVGVTKFYGQKLPRPIKESLDKALEQHPVDGILISTTPEQHRAYTDWALRAGIKVLLDKPITSRQSAANDPVAANGILKDWQHINKLSKQTNCFVMVNAHRRFHPAYDYVGKLLEEVSNELGIGVTSLSSFNSDGQWRLPNEMEDITYHGYDAGNGALSHFGYHYLDLITSWYRKGTQAESRADRARVYTSMSTAANYVQQIPQRLSEAILVRNNQPKPEQQRKELLARIKGYGEVDSFSSIEFMKGNTQTAHASLQMLHSGFSQRAWSLPAKNLYKEHGRLRWENHLIQHGPFHAIEVRSMQAVQPAHFDPQQGIPRWELGGSDQLEINVFRNKLIGGKPLETIQVKDLLDSIPRHDVLHEDVKAKTLKLFIGLIAYDNHELENLNASPAWTKHVRFMASSDDQTKSFIEAHQPTAAMMAAAYKSFANRQSNANPIAEVQLQW